MCLIAFLGMQAVNAEKFYLDVTNNATWQLFLNNTIVYGGAAKFKNSSLPTESTFVYFTLTAEANIYELTVPAGTWDKVVVGAYQLIPFAEAWGTTPQEYDYDGTKNCAVVELAGLAATLGTYGTTPEPVLDYFTAGTQFYLNTTGSNWATLEDSFYKAIFKNTTTQATQEVTFSATSINQFVWEVTIPAGSWNQVTVGRGLLENLAIGTLIVDQIQEYTCDGTGKNCATVTGGNLNATLTSYVLSAPATYMVGGNKFYLFPSTQWNSGLPRYIFKVLFKHGDTEELVTFTQNATNSSLYEVTVPNGNWSQLRLGRYDSNTASEPIAHKLNPIICDGSYNCITITDWNTMTTSVYTPSEPDPDPDYFTSGTQFYLNTTGSAWATLSDSFFKAIFKNSSTQQEQGVIFTVTSGDQYVYEVTIPVGSWDEVTIGRGLSENNPNETLIGDQIKVYTCDGTSKNCATVTGWYSDETLTTYTPPVAPTVEKFYLIPSADWLSGGATFAAIFKNGTTEQKVFFSLNSSTGKYELNVPVGDWPQICIKRYDPSGVNDWGGFSTFDAINEIHTNNYISYNRAFNYIELFGWANGTNSSDYALFSAVIWNPGATSEDWNADANWYEGTVPAPTGDIFISKTSTNKYPILTSSTTFNSITIESGAELGGQNYLSTTNDATVKMNLNKGRWYMLSMPMPVSDLNSFYFNDSPEAWFKKFALDENDAASWTYISDLATPYPVGKGFSYWIDGAKTDTKEVVLNGSIVTGTVDTDLDFGSDTNNGTTSYFALAGNPFMTSIDFTQLLSVTNKNGALNSTVISSNYLVWMGSGFVGYGTNGWFGAVNSTVTSYNTTAADKKIPPLQAIIVERNSTNSSTTGTIRFNVSSIQSTGTSVGLRSASNISDKLNIVASNERGAYLTFIAKREEGQSARKLKDEISKKPDVYTLAPDNVTALGANIVNTDDITIPVGIYTSYTGDMTLTFSGMDTYNANIKLIDTANNNAETELSGDSQEYTFAYAPAVAGQATEDRFYLVFSPKAITGVDEAAGQNTLVYIKDNAIYAVGSSGNLIQQLYVYDVQGKLIHAGTNLNTPTYTLDNLPHGSDIYLVKVITEKGVKNVKVAP